MRSVPSCDGSALYGFLMYVLFIRGFTIFHTRPSACRVAYVFIVVSHCQLPSFSLAAVKPEVGSGQIWVRQSTHFKHKTPNQHTHILFEIKVNTVMWRLQSVGRGLSDPAEITQDNINISIYKLQRKVNYMKFVSDAWDANRNANNRTYIQTWSYECLKLGML